MILGGDPPILERNKAQCERPGMPDMGDVLRGENLGCLMGEGDAPNIVPLHSDTFFESLIVAENGQNDHRDVHWCKCW